MIYKSTRWITWVLLAALCASLFSLPALAAAEGEQPPPAAEEPVPVEAAETPLVNVIETDDAAVPSETEDPAVPAETDDPAPAAEPAALEDGVPSAETEEPARETTDELSGELDGTPEEEGGEEGFTVSYYLGENLLGSETVPVGGKPAQVPAADGSGVPVKAWLRGDGSIVVPGDTAIEADTAFYAWRSPSLQTAEHVAYINGTGSARFSPAASLTRAQAATILYKLLTTQAAGPYSASFTDVSSSAWYAAAVTTLASCGVINGYADGSFRPNRTITRAEFVTMLVNLTGATGADVSFSDVSASHWARGAIAAASARGWVNGYTDGTFRPNQTITRAEAVVVMNRVLGRAGDKSTIDGGSGILHFIDVSASAWYYSDVMEASIGHAYSKDSGAEVWTGHNVEPSDLDPGLHKVGGVYVYVDANRQPTYIQAGVSSVGGMYVYARAAGYTFIGDLSSKPGCVVFADGTAEQALTDGFNKINSTLFYWLQSENKPQALTAGLNSLAGKTYWADADGYVIRNDFGKGVVSLGGKNYLSDGYCAVITTGLAYASDNAKPYNMDLRNKTFEYDGAMYYVQDDYTLATDSWVGYLYFGTNCKYTSGDSTLDGYVDDVVKDFVDNNSLTRVQKLLKAYIYLRGDWDSNTKTFTDHGFRYSSYNSMIFYRGRYRGQSFARDFIASAKQMLSLKYGMCYQWAAAYCYLARRVGMQTYLVVGGVFSNNATHCWNMIYWDGHWHISDVEIEWGWLQGWYGGGLKLYRNLFDQTLSTENLTYYQNPEVPSVCYTFPY